MAKHDRDQDGVTREHATSVDAQAWIDYVAAITGYAIPPQGWSEITTDHLGQRITYTEHGAGMHASPPHLPGWVCKSVIRHGNSLTRWSYRPIQEH